MSQRKTTTAIKQTLEEIKTRLVSTFNLDLEETFKERIQEKKKENKR